MNVPGVAWVEEAFGTKAGLIAGYLNWVSGATDNAIYPALFLQYVVSLLAVGNDTTETTAMLTSEGMRFGFTVIMTLVLAWINYRGLEIVGALSIVVCIVSMSPFVIMCLIGVFQLEPSRWFEMPLNPWEVQIDDDALTPGTSFFPSPLYAGVLWRPFLNNLFWNLNSFDAAGSFAGEIADSGRVFPRAMALG
jgi:amino acid transporter